MCLILFKQTYTTFCVALFLYCCCMLYAVSFDKLCLHSANHLLVKNINLLDTLSISRDFKFCCSQAANFVF